MLDLECKYDLFGWLYEAVIFRLVDTDDYLNEIYSVQRKHPSNCVTDYGSLVPSLRFSVKRGRIYTRGRARSSKDQGASTTIHTRVGFYVEFQTDK